MQALIHPVAPGWPRSERDTGRALRVVADESGDETDTDRYPEHSADPRHDPGVMHGDLKLSGFGGVSLAGSPTGSFAMPRTLSGLVIRVTVVAITSG